MTYMLKISLVNEDKGRIFSEWDEDIDPFDLTDEGEPDFGAIFRQAQREYGRCASSVYVDVHSGEGHEPTTCGNCGLVWCNKHDPAHGPLCPKCHGRGYTTAPVGVKRVGWYFVSRQEYDDYRGHGDRTYLRGAWVSVAERVETAVTVD